MFIAVKSIKSMSLDDQVDAVRQAIWRYCDQMMADQRRYGSESDPCPSLDAVAIYDSYAIVRLGLAHYRVDYTITNDGVQLADREQWQQVEPTWSVVKSLPPTEDTLISFGGSIKALGNGKVGGYLVLFGSADQTDASPMRDFFTPDTDFDVDWEAGPVKCSVYYQHGLDPVLKTRKLANATLTKDDIGIWTETQLALRDEYERTIYAMTEAGKQAWSSGTAPHLVERKAVGNAHQIVRWPLGLDASLTPTPAEPRIQAVALKSYIAELQPQANPQGAGDAPAVAAKTTPAISVVTTPSQSPSQSPKENSTMDPNELAAMKTQLGTITAILQRFETDPAVKSAGLVTVDGGKADKGVKSFADFLIAIKRNDAVRLAEHYGSTKTLSEDSGASGGYLTPTEYSNEIFEIAAEEEIVYPRAYKHPMSTNQTQIPVLKQTGGSAGVSGFFGGVVMNWTEENTALTETTPTFEMMDLICHSLGGFTVASNQIQADSAAGLEALLKRLFGRSVGWTRDYAFIRGNGVKKPQGFFNSPALIQVTRNTSNDFKIADAAGMLSRLPQSSWGKALWIFSQTVLPKLVTLAADSSNGVTFMPNLRDKIAGTLLGLPFTFSEKVPALGTAGDVNLVDLSYYVIGDRKQIEIAMSEHFRFTQLQNTWRVDTRTEGRPWVKSTITLADGATTVSPFVQLN
jgi:HK97 family phage major capsid protein